MQDLEDRLKELGGSVSRQAPSELRPTARALRRIRVGRAVRSGAVLATVAALVIGGFAGARSLSDDALPPADEDPKVSPFVSTWTTTDADGSTRTMVIRASGEDAYEITVQNHLALVCSGASSTLTGTGQLNSTTRLVIPSPEIACDDGSKPKVEDDLPPPEELLRDLTFEHDPESDILTNYSPFENRRVAKDGQVIYSGRTLVWGRAEAESRIGDVGGWITYGNERGIWALDLTSPGDPADRVRLSSTPGSPIEWSPDGSKLLVVRDVPPSDPSVVFSSDLFVVDSDGTETRLTDVYGSINGSSFSPDGDAVVYAAGKGIYVVDAEGGSPQLLRAPGRRRLEPGHFVKTGLQEPKWSPDGSQIAYFDGMGDWGNSLRVMDSDGTDSRVVVKNSETERAGHVHGLQWSPDGSQLAFSLEGRLYVVGVDGSGFRFVTDDGVGPSWSPDGSHIAYTGSELGSSERGSLEIVRLDDLQVQNFGDGESGPWTAELRW